MSLPKIYREDNCLYLIQDLSGLGTYDKVKAIVNFCDKETKRFEKEIDSVILEVFEKNGINIPNTEKSVLKVAFDTLKQSGRDIEITDLFKNKKNCELCEFIKDTKNHFTIIIETDYVCGCKKEIIECGIELQEKRLWRL